MAGLSTSTLASRNALHAYSILRTLDLDEARDGVARVFSPHELKVASVERRLDTRMCHVALGAVSINRLRYGATVDIDVGCTKDFLLVMMPMIGSSEIRCGDAVIRATPGMASVVSPTLPLQMRSQGDADQILSLIHI